MNTNTLSKHYSALNPRERFVLMEAAQLRDDTGELQRLHDAAAKLNYHVADHVPFADSWRLLEMAYIGDQMYECAAFWQAFYVMTRYEDVADHHSDLLFALAYRAVILFDGWAQFCEATQIAAPGSVQSYAGWPFIVDTVETARALAFTPEQMRDWVAEAHQVEPASLQPPSADQKARLYAEAYTQLLRQWGKA